jgi:hypothetical protein
MKVINTVQKTDTEEVQTETWVFSPKTYDRLKRLVQVILPAFATLYLALANTWNLPAAEQVVTTTTAVTAFLGVCLGISSKRYKESDAPHDGELVVTEDGGGVKGWMLSLDGDPELLSQHKSISFKVRKVEDYNPAA